MPVRKKRDSHGSYYQWGKKGKKYYYKPKDEKSKQRAYRKASRQGMAIILSYYS